ncbi:hypothetical protein E4W17_12065, partial [Neisseria meningitidis]|nr:hypothetical protein [Neisseria meningitidis]
CPCGNDEILSFRKFIGKNRKPLRRHSRTGFVIPAQASSFPHLLIHYIPAVFLHFRQNLSTKNNTSQIKTIISFAKIPPPVNINKNNY